MSNPNTIDFSKKRTISEIISVTFDFIKQNYKQLFLGLLYICGPFLFIDGIVNGLSTSYSLYETNVMTKLLWNIPNWLMVGVSIILINGVTYTYVELYKTKNYQDIQVSDLLQGAKDKFFMFFFNGIGLFFIICLYMLLLVIPGIYISIVLTIFYAVKVIEKKGFGLTITRCRYLVKGNWWTVFGLVFLLGLVQMPVSFIFNLPLTIYVMLNTILGYGAEGSGRSMNTIILIVTSIISALNYLIYAVSAIGIVFLYHSLVEMKEAKGLFDKIDSIGNPESTINDFYSK